MKNQNQQKIRLQKDISMHHNIRKEDKMEDESNDNRQLN